MHCSLEVVTNYRWGRFSTYIGENERPPITTYIAQRRDSHQTRKHKGLRHYRWECLPPIIPYNPIIIGRGGL